MHMVEANNFTQLFSCYQLRNTNDYYRYILLRVTPAPLCTNLATKKINEMFYQIKYILYLLIAKPMGLEGWK